MADFVIKQRHPNIHRITSDVSAAHTVTNSGPAPLKAGVLVEVTRGTYKVEHLDDATLVDLNPGQSVTIDPTTVTGATGVGFTDPRNIVESTAEFQVSEAVGGTPRTKAKAKDSK